MRGHLRKRGDAWELRAYAGRDPVSGRQIYRTRTYRGGKRDAEDALAKFVQEVAGGACTTRDATVGALIEAWFELAKADLSPSTVRGYETCIRCYIEPALGDIPLDRLRVAQLDRLYAHLRTGGGKVGQPLATGTIRQVHAVLRRALQQGVKWGWIQSNPAVLASPPAGSEPTDRGARADCRLPPHRKGGRRQPGHGCVPAARGDHGGSSR